MRAWSRYSFVGQGLLRPPAFLGHEAAPGPVQGFAQAADDRAGQHEEDQGARRLHSCRYGRSGSGLSEEVVRRDGAEDRGQQPGPKAAEVGGDHDRREEGHVRDRVAQHRAERPADQQREPGPARPRRRLTSRVRGVSFMPTSQAEMQPRHLLAAAGQAEPSPATMNADGPAASSSRSLASGESEPNHGPPVAHR